MRLNAHDVDPSGHKHLIAWAQYLDRSGLPKALRALVETRVSQINGCAFCLAMHTDEGRSAGLDQHKLDTVAAWRDDPAFTEQERAALELAESMTRIADGGHVTEEVWNRSSACFSEEELATLLQVVASINAFNRLNVATGRGADQYREQSMERP